MRYCELYSTEVVRNIENYELHRSCADVKKVYCESLLYRISQIWDLASIVIIVKFKFTAITRIMQYYRRLRVKEFIQNRRIGSVIDKSFMY